MKSVEQRLAWAYSACKKAQLRMTPARQKLLSVLAKRNHPHTLETIAESEELHSTCDATTIYRTLILLTELSIVRQVHLRHKSRYFLLNVPGGPSDFLICRSCGSVTELKGVEFTRHLQKEVGNTHHYADLYHELELYGVCPACQKTRASSPLPTKLPVR